MRNPEAPCKINFPKPEDVEVTGQYQPELET